MGMHDGTVLIWNLGDGTDQLKLRGHSSEVWAVTFNSLTEAAGEVLFASGGNDGFVCIWGLGKHSTTMATVGTLRHRLDSHRLSISCLSFCYCDAVRLVSGSRDGTAVVWDVVAGTKLRQLDLEARTGQRKTRDGVWPPGAPGDSMPEWREWSECALLLSNIGDWAPRGCAGSSCG
jgi:WD40 repeat protein